VILEVNALVRTVVGVIKMITNVMKNVMPKHFVLLITFQEKIHTNVIIRSVPMVLVAVVHVSQVLVGVKKAITSAIKIVIPEEHVRETEFLEKRNIFVIIVIVYKE
jgi:NOL1/NOP2/fmu family ribosome biogenesis protein